MKSVLRMKTKKHINLKAVLITTLQIAPAFRGNSYNNIFEGLMESQKPF